MASCFSKHFNSFGVLLFGRLTGGMATSLLFCAFEAWLVRENEVREDVAALGVATSASSSASSSSPSSVSFSTTSPLAAPPSDLRRIFGLMWFGSSIVAIAAGPCGDSVVGLLPLTMAGTGPFHYGGLTAPFDLAIVVLLLGLVLLTLTWQENRGDDNDVLPVQKIGDAGTSPPELLASAASVIAGSPVMLALLVVTACFEGSIYTFVFNWTSALTEGSTNPPALGSVFATLMLAYTSGSMAFQLLSSSSLSPGTAPEGEPSDASDPSGQLSRASKGAAVSVAPLRVALVLGPLALLAPALALNYLPAGSAERTAWVLGGFVAFEFCCGLYAPAISAVKGMVVPEALRSTIYSVFRAPMNVVVLAVLLWGAPPENALPVSVALLALAAIAGTSLPEACVSNRSSEGPYAP